MFAVPSGGQNVSTNAPATLGTDGTSTAATPTVSSHTTTTQSTVQAPITPPGAAHSEPSASVTNQTDKATPGTPAQPGSSSGGGSKTTDDHKRLATPDQLTTPRTTKSSANGTSPAENSFITKSPVKSHDLTTPTPTPKDTSTPAELINHNYKYIAYFR